ncbi:MAG TPA: HD domain-containing protein [Gemmatimonadales bacterium]|jgi:hypothetical protein
MAGAGAFEVIRDPLWNNIRIDREALAVLDSEAFQRLRYVRQLGHAYLVYPGATHTRFEHALGTYHLARRALSLFSDRGELEGVSAEEHIVIRLAALLHDVGHYPFSHALEEAGLPSHEVLAREHFARPQLHDALRRTGLPDLPERLSALIGGSSPSPLQGLVSGSIDLDKIEYLTRDARMCGVPYGTVDVDRLLNSLAVVTRPDGTRGVGVHAKGLSALESLLFAKYQMYRNVYWHHAVRSATAMFKRIVRASISSGHVERDWIPFSTDEELIQRLRSSPDGKLVDRLHRRRLFKRALDASADEIPAEAAAWIAGDPDLVELAENELATRAGLKPGELLLDYPAKPAMLAVDLPVLTRDGRVEQLTGQRAATLLGIQRVADELHTLARRLRVFVARPVEVRRDDVFGMLREVGE